MIEFRDVVKTYPGGHNALAGINLSISRGEMVVLRGHSGAGKSTLIKLLPALERPTSGVITIPPYPKVTLPLIIPPPPHHHASTRVYPALHPAGLGGREKAFPQELSG